MFGRELEEASLCPPREYDGLLRLRLPAEGLTVPNSFSTLGFANFDLRCSGVGGRSQSEGMRYCRLGPISVWAASLERSGAIAQPGFVT